VDAGDSSFTSPFIGSSRAFRYLHCGDFRASPRHVLHPAIKGKNLHHVYLDTTYLDPKVWRTSEATLGWADPPIQYTFPPQPQVISACADLAQRLSAFCPQSGRPEDDSPTPAAPHPAAFLRRPGKVLIVVGSVFTLLQGRLLSNLSPRTYSVGKERVVSGKLGARLLHLASATR